MAETERTTLDGWKAIASYLKKDVRTAMRWEQARGMPVHRVPGGKGGTVYAFADELATWKHSVGDEAPQQGAPEQTSPHKAVVPQPEIGPARQDPPTRARIAVSRRRLLGVVLVLTLLFVLVGIAMFAGRHPDPADHVSFSGRKLLAYDQNGRVAWEHEFPQRLENPSLEAAQRPRFFDLDGDGHQELLIVVALTDEGAPGIPREHLCCFLSSGEMLWSYEPKLTLTFGERRYESPWRITDLLTCDGGAGKSLWLAMTHHTWWPSFVARLDPKGNPTVQFVNSGGTYRLGYVRNDRGSFILACGVNNEYSAGSLAVLDVSQAPSASPQSPGSVYTCDACPEGRPQRYYLFPRSELNTLQGAPYNPVKDLRIFENYLELATREVEPTAQFLYQLSKDLDVESVSMTDGYAEMHRRLSSEHRMEHTLQECPTLRLSYKVRIWDATNGWTEKLVPWTGVQQR